MARGKPTREWPEKLSREEACEYLRVVHELVRAPSTLAKAACVGGGPRFGHRGRNVYYEPAWLDAWAASITKPPGE